MRSLIVVKECYDSSIVGRYDYWFVYDLSKLVLVKKNVHSYSKFAHIRLYYYIKAHTDYN